MNDKLKIAVCQLRTELDGAQTMDKAASFVRRAAEGGADFTVLPEMFCCPYSSRYFRAALAEGHEKTVESMSAWARENGVYLVGGSVPETEGERLYNSCYVFDRTGRQIAKHRKVHLFDVTIPGMRFHESDSFSPGREITVFDTEYGKMGAAICFDVRFPELFRAMAVRGAKVIFLPAQFNRTTGPAHWADTLKMRAVDNELFFVGASAARYEGFDYLTLPYTHHWGLHARLCRRDRADPVCGSGSRTYRRGARPAADFPASAQRCLHGGGMKIIDQIKKYAPCCEQEARDKKVILDYLANNPGAFFRSDLIAHMTASSWIVNAERTKVVMVYHRIYDSWSWTGGHADGEEDLLAVALRECREETGLQNVRAVDEDIFSLEVLTVDGHEKRGEYVPSHLHLNVTYLLEADEREKLCVCEEENSGVRWFTLDEALAASTEPWFVERIYKKLNDKLKR